MAEPPSTTVFSPDTEFGSRLLVEVVRGCANLCRFCWAGYNYLPVRAFDADRILALAEAARPHSSRVGLVSIALCDHPEIERILARLHELGYGISPASLRLDDLTEPIVRLLRASGERSITIAPETGSDRLRRVINKTVTNAQILDRAELVFASGIENLKLYYMIGLPTETDEDLVAIRDLTIAIRDRMLHHARGRGAIGRIVASVNPLVPKPGTAYQWMPMEPHAVTEKKMRRLRQLVSDLDNVYFSIKSERHSYYQALLSLGDRRVAPVIEAAERNGGQWRAAVAEVGLDADWYVFRDRSDDPCLPWDVIDGGMKAELPPQGVRARPSRGVDLVARRVARRAVIAPAPVVSAPDAPLLGHRGLLLVRLVRLEDQVAHAVLRVAVDERTQQREAPALAVDRVLTRRERDVAARAVTSLPDGEANQLHAIEHALAEVQFGVGEFAGRVALVVAADLHLHVQPPLVGCAAAAGPGWQEIGGAWHRGHLASTTGRARDVPPGPALPRRRKRLRTGMLP